MAGYVLKIVIENTHPPVWRRVLVPDKISFGMLHRIIQILFGWNGSHLHEFRLPGKDLSIGPLEFHDGDRDMLDEDDTMLEEIIAPGESIRYIYDFGDNWIHKIIFENIDETCDSRYPILIKFKSDNFAEDSGGVYASQERVPFDPEYVTSRLRHVVIPESGDGYSPMQALLQEDFPGSEKLREIIQDPELLSERLGVLLDKINTLYDKIMIDFPADIFDLDQSALGTMLSEWMSFDGSQLERNPDHAKSHRYRISVSDKSIEEMLRIYTDDGLADLCRYLQLPAEQDASGGELAHILAGFLSENPRYILYTLNRSDLSAVRRLLELAGSSDIHELKLTYLPLKAVSIGLLRFRKEISDGQETALIEFASDAGAILDSIDAVEVKRIYAEIDRFDDRLAKFMTAYGMIDIDRLYEMYVKIYSSDMSKTEFLRYVYWFGTCNLYVSTFTSVDGTRYVADIELDSLAVMNKSAIYAADLDYRVFSRKELREMSDSSYLHKFFDELVKMLTALTDLSEDSMADIVSDIWHSVRDGDPVSDIAFDLDFCVPQDNRIMVSCDIWRVLILIICNMPVPVLKGWSRIEYANETGVKIWLTGIVNSDSDFEFTNDVSARLYELPAEIQYLMVKTVYEGDEALQELMEYREKHGIKSEELAFFIATELLIRNRPEDSAALLEELDSGTEDAVDAVDFLISEIADRKAAAPNMDSDVYEPVDHDPFPMGSGYEWSPYDSDLDMPKPYKRDQRKIGRNEQCPCGSGKKYKHCCGRKN